MPTKQQAITAASTILQAAHTELADRVLLDPWSFGTGQTFYPQNERTFTKFAVVGRDDGQRVDYNAFNDFAHTTVDNNWPLVIFVALAPGSVQIDTAEWYDMIKTAYQWEANLRALVVGNSEFNSTVRQVGLNNRPFLRTEFPRLRMYMATMWWGVTAYADVIQEI